MIEGKNSRSHCNPIVIYKLNKMKFRSFICKQNLSILIL